MDSNKRRISSTASKSTSGRVRRYTIIGIGVNASSQLTIPPPIPTFEKLQSRKRKDNSKENVSVETPKKKGKDGQTKNCQDQLVSDALECIICLEFAASPIHNCANGHITCGICVKKLPEKKCSMCKAKLSVSVFGERLAKQLELKLKCDFYDEGCTELIKSTDFKDHVATKCYYRPVDCRQIGFSSPRCKDKAIPISELASHLRLDHFMMAGNWSFARQYQSYIRFQKNWGKANRQAQMLPTRVLNCKGKFFIRMAYQTKDTYYFWIIFPGSQAEADQYAYSLKLMPCSNPDLADFNYAVKLPVFPLHSDFGFKKPSPLFASFPMPLLRKFGKPVPICPSTAGSPPVQEYDCRFEVAIFSD